MRRFLTIAKGPLKWIAAYGSLPLIMAVTLTKVIPAFRALRGAEIVVVMPEGGFGHTVTGPDVARRQYAGKRCAFIVFSEYGRHNWKVAAIWPDLSMAFFPLSLGWSIGGRSLRTPVLRWYKTIAPRAMIRLIRLVGGPKVLVITLLDLYAQITDATKSQTDRLTVYHRWPVGYFKLMREVAMPPAALPARRQHMIRGKLKALSASMGGPEPVRLCCLYLRQLGAGHADITSSRRDGSPLIDYMDGLRLLNQADYQVLLTGDVSLEPGACRESGGMLVDANSLGVSSQLFSIYAATECDIFVGEAGGATWLPGVNEIPRLVLNALPYIQGFPNSWMYYKTVTDPEGKLVHYKHLFADHAFDFELQRMTVHDNSSSEISEAISCFLEDVARPPNIAPEVDPILEFPEHTRIRHAANCRLSPAFLKLFEPALSATHEAR